MVSLLERSPPMHSSPTSPSTTPSSLWSLGNETGDIFCTEPEQIDGFENFEPSSTFDAVSAVDGSLVRSNEGLDDEDEWSDDSSDEDPEEDTHDSGNPPEYGASSSAESFTAQRPSPGIPTMSCHIQSERFIAAPALEPSRVALKAVKLHLQPPRGKKPTGTAGVGYKKTNLNPLIRTRLAVKSLLELYTHRMATSNNPAARPWTASSVTVAQTLGKPPWFARTVRKWTRSFINNPTVPPVNPYGKWVKSRLLDEDLMQDIQLHLQEVGKYVRALDIVHYLDQPDVKARHGLKKTISVATAQRWMHVMGYRWKKEPKGQYADGHEREDVVAYRQNISIPAWNEREARMRSWSSNDPSVEETVLPEGETPEIAWFHDESIFYANDRRKVRWVHESETAKPYAKGEGPSLMVADFFSADYGFLRTPDGSLSARVLFKPGKGRNGYWTWEDVVAQARQAMGILKQHFTGATHTFYYDNARIHLKRPEGSLSALKMPKNTPADGKNWGVEVTLRDDTGKPIYAPNGSICMHKIRTHGARFADGTPQDLYFPEGHRQAGKFKGMAVILEERGYGNMSKVLAQCKGFKCAPGATNCCCRRMLYNEPDFMNVESELEQVCRTEGFRVVFLPKFHCEINPIEQCWGHAKREYRLNPPSSEESALERNVVNALDSIKIEPMRR